MSSLFVCSAPGNPAAHVYEGCLGAVNFDTSGLNLTLDLALTPFGALSWVSAAPDQGLSFSVDLFGQSGVLAELANPSSFGNLMPYFTGIANDTMVSSVGIVYDVHNVPEPSSLALLGVALLGVQLLRRRRT